MEQLRMIRYSGPVTDKPLPEGYSFKLFGGTDEEIAQWVGLCVNGLIPSATAKTFDDTVRNYENIVAEKDCLFVADPDGKYVMTSTYYIRPNGEGLVHMVASAPESRGKGLGHAILAEGLRMLEARGCKVIRLKSDDFRLAAIKTYLVGGFKPVIFDDPDSDMEERWNKVCEQLNFKTDYVYEK